jgi:hypothetical protein
MQPEGEITVLGLLNGCYFCCCAQGLEEMTKVIGALVPMHQLPPRNQAKAEVCGGGSGSPRPHGFPSFFRRGRPAGEAMAPVCDLGSGLSIGAERDIEGIGSLDEIPEDLRGRNVEVVIPEVALANGHQPDEASIPAARNRKYTSSKATVELVITPSRATSRQLFSSADVSTSHDFG